MLAFFTLPNYFVIIWPRFVSTSEVLLIGLQQDCTSVIFPFV